MNKYCLIVFLSVFTFSSISFADEKKTPTAKELLENSFKTVKSNVDLKKCRTNGTQNCSPRHKYISNETTEHKYLAYLESCHLKVERIGKLNFPSEAKREDLTGSVEIEVAINSDETLNDVTIIESSGHEELDNAVFKIINLASPFISFPEDIKEEADILHITQTWRFVISKPGTKAIVNWILDL